MQSLYKIIKAPETSGSEIIYLPDIKSIQEKKEQKRNDSTSEYISEINELLSETHKKADMIINDAESAAKKLLEDARVNAQSLQEKAREDGFQQGYRQGYNEGYEYGINEAKTEADDIRKDADTYIETCKSEVDQYIRNKQKEIIQLSISISRQIINGEVMADPDIVTKIAEKVLSQAVDRKHVILKVNPSDFSLLKSKKDDLSIYVENPNNLFIIADSAVAQGSVKAETASGFVDGDIDTQLEMVAKILLRN